MHVSSLIVGAVIVLYAVIVGLAIIAFGQLLLAFREIAFNTRKEGVKTPHYEVLLIMAKINNILGWILLVAGVAAGIYMAVAGPGITIAGDMTRSSVL
jgi:hypothetical protein